MSEVTTIVIILALVSIVWVWGLISQSRAKISWHPVDARYEVIKSWIPRRDMIHENYLLSICYQYKEASYVKMITLKYNRRTCEFYALDREALHRNDNILRILVNPRNANQFIYQKEPWWMKMMIVMILATLWTAICYYLAKQSH